MKPTHQSRPLVVLEPRKRPPKRCELRNDLILEDLLETRPGHDHRATVIERILLTAHDAKGGELRDDLGCARKRHPQPRCEPAHREAGLVTDHAQRLHLSRCER